MKQYYNNDANFFGLFETDTFDVEEYDNGNFRGYVWHGWRRVLAGTFDYDGKSSGTGWYDNTVI